MPLPTKSSITAPDFFASFTAEVTSTALITSPNTASTANSTYCETVRLMTVARVMKQSRMLSAAMTFIIGEPVIR